MNPSKLALVKDSATLPLGLSLVVPVYNEERTICDAICELATINADFSYEIIVLNDGSTDSTAQILREPQHLFHIRYVEIAKNAGKGNAVKLGVELARFSHILVFDADLEYFGHDIGRLFRPIQMGVAPAVYGVRLRGNNTMQPSYLFASARKYLTAFTNILYGSAISDLHTCLKLFPTDFLRSLELHQNGFGLDTEITALALRSGLRPFEIPVTYVGRTKEEGKKIHLGDGVKCLWILIRIRFGKKINFEKKKYAPRNRNFIDTATHYLEVQGEYLA